MQAVTVFYMKTEIIFANCKKTQTWIKIFSFIISDCRYGFYIWIS